MEKSANFLCEIGTEEIPAGYIPAAIKSINQYLNKNLTEQRIDFKDINIYATPRRIAILIDELAESQRKDEVEVKGPSIKAAYDGDGKPTKALEGFLRGNNVKLEDVTNKKTDKGEYIYATKKLESKNTVEIIPDIVNNLINAITFPKSMRWSDKNISFPRPINYFLILFNNKVVPFELDGIVSDNKTRGHYIQHDKMLEIKNIKDYMSTLKKNSVLLDHDERKEFIRKELYAAAKKAGGQLMEDEDLLDTVTYLVEDPHIVVCEFEKEFLKIPDIVLIAEMKEHQKYFAVVDKDGKLTNKFLVTSNNPSTDHIKIGNVRVVTARFNDAQFFYEEDGKTKLIDRVESLKNVLFHKELGSIYEKVERMVSVSEKISDSLGLDDKTKEKIKRAVLLCKTDLETSMVYEFASLQGQIGKIYAINDGEDEDVALAIEEHYKPKNQEDTIPTNIVSVVAAISEKIDNIFGSFSVGNIPKGSQDPYALRRQANAIVDVLIRNDLNVALREVLEAISSNYKDGEILVNKIIDFIKARAKTIFLDNGFAHDEIDACLSIDNTDYLELFRRARSLNEFRKNENFSEMLLSFKRMNNIVSAFRKDNKSYELSYDSSLVNEKEEKNLYKFFEDESKNINSYINDSKYIDLFELLTKGKPVIDSFFDKVLVMDKDEKIRDNRLYMLENILGKFSTLIDFSKISGN